MGAMMGMLSQSLSNVQSLNGAGAQAQTKTGKAVASPAAAASGAASTSSSDTSSATISSNDFLSLLVTEMQNQDPTAQTDPNEYINQLVQVNSLEQLISINQNLTTALGSPSSSSGNTSGASASDASTAGASSLAGPATATAQVKAASTGQSVTPTAASGGSSTASAISRFVQSVGVGQAPGNLAVPAAQPASKTVAHALDGHRHAGALPGQLSGTP